MRRWLILADDLTGAADAAVAFARRGLRTEVGWGAGPAGGDCEVQALDLDTRGASAGEAAARHQGAVRRLRAADQRLYKKIDSTLRGHPAAEIAAIGAALRELGQAPWGLLAPANPAMQRTTRDGRVFVKGLPLESSETWQREHSYADADLVSMVQFAGLHAIKLPLAVIRGDEAGLHAAFRDAAASAHVGGAVLVCDAETDGDLRRVVSAARECEPGFFIGTAGLANALAAEVPAKDRPPIALEPATRGTLVAVGTMARVSHESARRLATREGGNLVAVNPQGGGSPDRQFATMVAGWLARGETAVALLEAPDSPDIAVDPGHAEYFSGVLGVALRQMGALIVTGGETAATLLARCKVHGIRLLDELEPGIALGLTQGEIEVPIITKPGAFGDEDSLARCLDALNQLRRTA